MKMMGSEEAQNQKTLQVSDGQFMWSETRQGDQVMGVTKTNAPKREDQEKQMLEMIEQYEATVKPSEEVNGEKCAVLEIKMTQGQMAMTMTMWLSEKYGEPMKIVQGGGMMGTTTMTTKKIEADIKIEDSQFTYTPAEGVTVTDMTSEDKPAADAPKASNEDEDSDEMEEDEMEEGEEEME